MIAKLLIQFTGRALLYVSGFAFGVFWVIGRDHLSSDIVMLLSLAVPLLSNIIFGVMASWNGGE